MKFSKEVMPLKVTSGHKHESCILNHFKMVDVETSEVDAKITTVSLGLSRD
jgi:hypothetical protein